MKERSSISLIPILTPLLVLAVGVGGYVAIVKYCKKPVPEKAVEKELPPLVRTMPVKQQVEGLTIDADGVVVPYREITINAEVAGRLVKKVEVCQAGNYVKSGTLLMRIDPTDYQFDVQRLEKEVEQAKTAIREIEVQSTNTKPLIDLARETLELQRRQLHRVETLETKKAVSKSDLDAERRNELAARDALTKLENQLRVFATQKDRFRSAMELAQVQLDRAKRDLSRTEITAPIDGMIVNDYVESDTYVNRGERLFAMEDVSAVEVLCNLRMDDLFWIWGQKNPAGKIEKAKKTGDDEKSDEKNDEKSANTIASKSAGTSPPVRLGPAANKSYTPPPTPTSILYTLGGRDYIWQGTLTRYEGIGLDEATRTVPCTVVVSDPSKVEVVTHPGAKPQSTGWQGAMALVRGMYVKLQIHTKPYKKTLLNIPESALRPGNRVWRVRDDRLGIVPVRVISTMDSDVVVEPVKEGDLTDTDRVVVEPLAAAEEGMAVREAK